MTAASLGFALAGNVWALGASRLFQGIGSSFSWAGGLALGDRRGPARSGAARCSERRWAPPSSGATGPVVGALAGIVGTRPALSAASVAGAVLVGWAAATPGIAPERQTLRAGLLAVRERSLLAGLWLIMLPALLFGVLIVLVPLQLNGQGWGTIAIGALFVVTTAVETVAESRCSAV